MEPTDSAQDWEQQARELAEGSGATSRFSGYKGIRPDENLLNHSGYSLARGYADGSDSEGPARANHLAHKDDSSELSSQATSSLDKGVSGKSSRGKPTSRHFRVGTKPTEIDPQSELY